MMTMFAAQIENMLMICHIVCHCKPSYKIMYFSSASAVDEAAFRRVFVMYEKSYE